MEKMIRVVVIEDHHWLLKAVVDELGKQPDIEVVGSATHGDKLFQLLRNTRPDVVVLDLSMSEGVFKPLPAVRQVMHEYPETRILVLTGLDDELLMRKLIDAGVRGYLLKGDKASMKLVAAVYKIARGEPVYSVSIMEKFISTSSQKLIFTEQEKSILQLLAEGLDNDSIGEKSVISERRVRNILSQIYRKMRLTDEKGINRRVAAVARAREMGLFSDE